MVLTLPNQPLQRAGSAAPAFQAIRPAAERQVVSLAKALALKVLLVAGVGVLISCAERHSNSPVVCAQVDAADVVQELVGFYTAESGFINHYLDLEPGGQFLWRTTSCETLNEWATGTWTASAEKLYLSASFTSADCADLFTSTEILRVGGHAVFRLPWLEAASNESPPWFFSVLHTAEARGALRHK